MLLNPLSLHSLPPVGDDLPCPAWVRPSLSGNGNQSRKKEEERPKFALSFFPLSHCRRSEEMGPPPSAGPTSAGRRRHRSCSDGPKTWTCRFSPGPFFSSCSFTLFTRTRFLVPPCGIPPTPRSELGSNQMRPIDCNSISGAIICYLSALSDRRRRGHITSSHSGTFSRTEGVLGGGEGRARRRRTDGQPC